MPTYGFLCDKCGTEDEIVLQSCKSYSDEVFPACVRCGDKMRRDWRGGGRITHQSKGRFGFVTNNMGDGPQYVHDYNDLQRKLKSRGLHITENDSETMYTAKHLKDST